ncbi:MAG: PD40 domain-containing protein, partial [Gemmatimonadetes bacterium]|nr:PD40 domain-containing protein [Gemmatimonadota bacterium]
SEQFPALSPDNQWFAYTSNQSGRDEVYLRRVDGTGAQLQVSARGGVEPAWSGTGRELFYRTRDTDPQLMVAELAFTPEPAVRSRTPLFSVAQYATATPHTNYAVSPDGQLFAMVRTNPSARIMVIQNLPALVERLRGEGVAP